MRLENGIEIADFGRGGVSNLKNRTAHNRHGIRTRRRFLQQKTATTRIIFFGAILLEEGLNQ